MIITKSWTVDYHQTFLQIERERNIFGEQKTFDGNTGRGSVSRNLNTWDEARTYDNYDRLMINVYDLYHWTVGPIHVE
jgi:hypothetical protein